MHCWGGGAAKTASSGMADDSVVTIINHFYNGATSPSPSLNSPDGGRQGYSIVLNLNLRWVNGQLFWHDPATGQPILTYEDQRARADSERNRADSAETEFRSERDARIAAEARIRELELRLEQPETP